MIKHLSTLLRSIAIAAAFCWTITANAQNVVVDGGFEATPPGSSAFSSAWTLTPPAGGNTGQQFSNVGTSTTFAHSGENYANLAPEIGQAASLSQTLSTVAGRRYTLSFFLANDSSLPVNFFRALVNGSVVFETTSPPYSSTGVYEPVTASFVANSSSTTLEFHYRHDDDYWRLDDVSVIAETTNRLLNISTRLRVLTQDNVLIGGFIVNGFDPERILIRAIGPSLSERGIQGPLLDPILELHSSTGLLRSNDNWKDEQRQEIEATGIPPQDDRESAIVATVPAAGNAYTAVVRGKNETTGVALVEVYDLTQGTNSRLANLSSRGLVTTGENVMIGGFFIGGGQGNARVVVRAIGPSLSGRGVSGALPDPTVQLVDHNGNEVFANDNWKDSQQSQIEAVGLQPADDRESALIASLPAENYTAVVRGKGGVTGVALVEVYQVD